MSEDDDKEFQLRTLWAERLEAKRAKEAAAANPLNKIYDKVSQWLLVIVLTAAFGPEVTTNIIKALQP